jgi:hypothetical protein
MEITVEQLEAKRQELLAAIEETKGTLNANYGALQVVDQMLVALKAPPARGTKSEK